MSFVILNVLPFIDSVERGEYLKAEMTAIKVNTKYTFDL
jgi:hypothetical protein